MSHYNAYLGEKPCTAFTNVKTDVLVNCTKLKTEEFLDASRGVVHLVERFGKVFAPVTHDMDGNIRKLTEKYTEDTELHTYLEDMILAEKEAGRHVVIDSLLWLRRALHFVTVFFQCVVDDTMGDIVTEDLTSFIKTAYSEALERYHGWLGAQLFNVLSRFIPSRQNLLYKLALDDYNINHIVLKDMKEFSTNMAICVHKLKKFYDDNSLDNEMRV